MKKLITVFTPSYNREHTLPKLYESLVNQSNKDFAWLIVDDGSSDGTKSLIERWKVEGLVDIHYIYKENGGMHTAHNVAYDVIDTELNVCIDSDDYMPTNAIERIAANWDKYRNDETIAGIIGLDQDTQGELIGSNFPFEHQPTTLGKLYHRHGMKGDKKLVFRNSITKRYPRYPEFPNERLVPLDTLYMLIAADHLYLAPINEVFCTVDYQVDGSSASILKQYFQSPRGFRFARETAMRVGETFAYRMRNAFHYDISTFIMKDYKRLVLSPNPLATLLFSPFAAAVYLYLRYKLSKLG